MFQKFYMREGMLCSKESVWEPSYYLMQQEDSCYFGTYDVDRGSLHMEKATLNLLENLLENFKFIEMSGEDFFEFDPTFSSNIKKPYQKTYLLSEILYISSWKKTIHDDWIKHHHSSKITPYYQNISVEDILIVDDGRSDFIYNLNKYNYKNTELVFNENNVTVCSALPFADDFKERLISFLEIDYINQYLYSGKKSPVFTIKKT